MRLPFFRAEFLTRLKANADENASKYGLDTGWIEALAKTQSYFRESNQIVDPPPELIFAGEDNPQHDAENAKRIYLWLADLTPAVAMEERLWAFLTHCTFPAYMRARWPVSGPGTLLRRYFLEGQSFAALSRNGIGRLWWAGYLTRDERRINPFELTETLFLRQDVQVALLERSLGKCATARTAVLDYVRTNQEWLGEYSFGRRVQVLVKELNLLGGVAVLDALPPASITAYLHKVSKELRENND
ncbi:MAG: DUF6339 family protein [Gemmatimonadales bacterium]|nr:DUF6339 family protein [Gemmatimonadales bacterium]